MFAAALLASSYAAFGDDATQSFCRLQGTFTATTPIAQLTTFNRDGLAAAGNALCNAIEENFLAVSTTASVDCVVVNDSLVALVSATSGTIYECRAKLTNKVVCPTKTGDDDTSDDTSDGTDDDTDTDDDDDDKKKKRQVPQLQACGTYRTFQECTLGCGGSLISTCPCYWDNIDDANGFPRDVDEPCRPGEVCCHNPPCNVWDDEVDCEQGSLRLDGGESNCLWSQPNPSVPGTCECRPPLVPEPDVLVDAFTPFDCTCPVASATNVTASQCAALLTPTQAQLLAIRRYNSRLGRVAARVTFRAFIKSCKKAQTKVTVKPNSKQSLQELVGKYSASLRAQRIAFQLGYEQQNKKIAAVFVFYPDDAPKLKAVADNTFTAEDYDSLELSEVEGFEAASASNVVTSIAAAVVAVISVNV